MSELVERLTSAAAGYKGTDLGSLLQRAATHIQSQDEALEALEFYENDNHVTYAIGPDWAESRERLENRGYTCVNGDTNLYVERGAKAAAAATIIRSALAEQPAQQQEPVAIVEVVVPHLESIVVKHILGAPFPQVGDFIFTSQPASKPLTDEQAEGIAGEAAMWGDIWEKDFMKAAVALIRKTEACLAKGGA